MGLSKDARMSSRSNPQSKKSQPIQKIVGRIHPENSLQSKRPDIAVFWDQTRNYPLTPSDVSYGSGKWYWWKCDAGEDHKWFATVNHMTRPSRKGCPYCSPTNKKTSKNYNLERLHPQLCLEWDKERNGELKPSEVSPRSDRRVFWNCEEGHSWTARIADRTDPNQPTTCPYCNLSRPTSDYNFAAVYPHLAEEWDYEENQGIRPEDILPRSSRIFGWRCKKGHKWVASPYKRVLGVNCPDCSKRRAGKEYNLALLFPEIAKEWHPTKNGKLTPDKITPGSRRKRWWLCLRGHDWLAEPNNRTGKPKSGCPYCRSRTSEREIRVFCELKNIFPNTRRIEKLYGRECDIFVPEYRFGIEVDGKRHHESLEKQVTDRQKNDLFNANGIILFRVRDFGLQKLNPFDILCRKAEGDFSIIKRLLQRIVSKVVLNGDDSEKIRAYLLRNNYAQDQEFRKITSYLPGPEPENSLSVLYPDIATEWDYEENSPLTPDMFTPGSKKRVRWKCLINPNHTWETAILNRTTGNTGCPYCGNKAVNDENNLEVLYPRLAREWDYDKNHNLPSQITPGHDKPVWWNCPDCQYSWDTPPYRRTGKQASGCPNCAGKVVNQKNNFAVLFPQLASKWHPTKNKGRFPQEFLPRSNFKACWLCDVCGNEWHARIADISKGKSNCPDCSKIKACEKRRNTIKYPPVEKTIKHLHPEICRDWDYEKNAPYLPTMFTVGSAYRAAWKCQVCGHEWQVRISDRVKCRCPKCSNSMRRRNLN